jgi:hypothetical protein
MSTIRSNSSSSSSSYSTVSSSNSNNSTVSSSNSNNSSSYSTVSSSNSNNSTVSSSNSNNSSSYSTVSSSNSSSSSDSSSSTSSTSLLGRAMMPALFTKMSIFFDPRYDLRLSVHFATFSRLPRSSGSDATSALLQNRISQSIDVSMNIEGLKILAQYKVFIT